MGKPSKAYVRSRLVNYTNADCSDVEVKNSRYHYYLKFDEDIGWDWIEAQINKCCDAVGLVVEPYKIRPSGVNSFEVEVREVNRRRGIDDQQHALEDF